MRLDLLLIYPPWAVLNKRGVLQNSLPPLGILSIASYCLKHNFSVEILDVHANRLTEQDVIAELEKKQPRFVGISVLTNMAIPAHHIARLCKKIVPDCTVVAGGVHAEAMPESMLRNSSIDLVGRGDGEDLMLEVLQGKPHSDILGLSYRSGDTVINNPARKINKELDDYPMPAYHLIDFSKYFPALGSYHRYPAINMLMTRGCPGKCTFCNSAFTTLRSRSARSMVEQIKVLRQQYGIRQIQFYDDTFTVAKQRVLEFCELLVKDKVDITWTAYIRADCFSEKMAEAMKKAGCHQVLIGIESGDDRILKSIQKPIDKKRYKNTVKIAHDYGLEVRGSFIIGSLQETKESMLATLNFAKELDIDLFQLNIMTPYPGTQIFQTAEREGSLLHTNWNEYGQGEVLLKNPSLTAEEIYQFEKYAFKSFYLRPKQLMRQLRRITSFKHIRDLFLGFYTMMRGNLTYKDPKWECWLRYNESAFFDLEIKQPKVIRLTYELRQAKVNIDQETRAEVTS